MCRKAIGMDVKKDKLYYMRNLGKHLEELFELCGIAPEKVMIADRSGFVQFLEKILKDTDMCNYLEALDAQSTQAIEAMKDRSLEEWNHRQNTERLVKLQQEKEELEVRCSKLEKKLDECQIQAATAAPMVTNDTGFREQIRMLIEMRDTLSMRARWIEDNAPEEVAAKKLIGTQLEETARILQSAGIEISEGTGVYDRAVHTVVGTVIAESEEQIGHIAQTVRSGYSMRGEILRSQEVMIYVKGEE